jgi:anti-anti-sigma factor
MAQVVQEGNSVRIRFSGQLAFAACDALDGEIEAVLQKEPESVVFDLAEVTFIGSIFIRLCLKTFKKMGREHFRIVNVSPAVQRIFVMAGLDEMLKPA